MSESTVFAEGVIVISFWPRKGDKAWRALLADSLRAAKIGQVQDAVHLDRVALRIYFARIEEISTALARLGLEMQLLKARHQITPSSLIAVYIEVAGNSPLIPLYLTSHAMMVIADCGLDLRIIVVQRS